MIGRCWRRGLLSSPFQRRRFWPRRANANGKSPCTFPSFARPATYQRRLEIVAREQQFAVQRPRSAPYPNWPWPAPGQQFQLLEKRIAEYRQEIRRRFARHPAAKPSGSRAGAGEKIAPRLLAEIGNDRELFPESQARQCLAGAAPVSYQSGQIHRVYLRLQCNKSLRNAVHLWANLSREFCPWAATYYTALRAKGKSHACALRALG